MDKMIAASLKDISDSEISSGDEEDPDLVVYKVIIIISHKYVLHECNLGCIKVCVVKCG